MKEKRLQIKKIHADKLLFESNSIPMWIYDIMTLRFLDVNEAAVINYGYTKDEFLNMSLSNIRVKNTIENIKKSREEYQFTRRLKHKRKDGSIIDVAIISSAINFKGRKANFVAVIDTIEHINSKIKRRQHLDSEKEIGLKSEEYLNKLEFLIEAGKLLSSSFDYIKTLQLVAELVTPKTADWCVIKLLVGDKLQSVAISHKDPQKIELAFEIGKKYPAHNITELGAHKVLKTLLPEFYPEIPEELLNKFTKDKENYRIIKLLGIHTAMALPLIVHNKAIGVLTLFNSENSRNFDKADLHFANELAKRAAMSIENARLYKDSLNASELLGEKIIEQTKLSDDVLTVLRYNEEKLRMIFENIYDYGIIYLDKYGEISSWNIGAKRLTLYEQDEIIGKHFSIFFTEKDKEKNAPQAELNEAFMKTRSEIEGWRVKKDGTQFWTNSTVYSIINKENVLDGYVKIMKDMTERKKYEDKLKDQSQKLNELNKELESFSYSVSHDLRSPLRHINGFVNLLKLDKQNKLSNESQTYFNYVIESVNKMENLIENLLSFSRAGRSGINMSDVELYKLIIELIEDFKYETTSRKIHWEIEKLPVIFGDKFMIKQVFINLISNALKFTMYKEETIIKIGFVENEKEIEVYVKDNGVGFDMKYANKLFGVFQRLHSESEFSGTGIGLANVKRIIDRHGGRVWGNGEINNGATIYFTLKKGYING